MDKQINEKDLDFILESLEYTRLKFENYDQYPNIDFKQERLNDVNDVIKKVKNLKKTFKEF